MTAYIHRCMIVPASQQALAQRLCGALGGPAGKGMFTTGLSADGTEPASHYISAGHIEDTFAVILPLTTVTPAAEIGAPPTIETRPGNVEVVEAIALQAGFTLPPGTIAALFDAIDVSEQGPFEAMARLGLQLATRINVNDASKTALESAPGIGAVKAQQIIDGRPWASVADLAGIGLDVAVLDHWYTV